MELRERLAEMTAARPFTVSWYLIDLRDSREFHERGDTPVPCAGTDRLLLYLSCLRAVQRGQLDLSVPVTYEERHRSGAGSGIIRWMSPGLTITLGDALAQTIITGDSVATALVREELAARTVPAPDLVDGFCADAGLAQANCATSRVTSAYDQACLVESLVALARGAPPRVDLGIDQSLAARALDVMSSVLSTAGISAHLPGYGPFNARVAHLTCDGGNGEQPARHWADAGVVYQEGAPSYVLAAFCTGVPETVDGLPGAAAALGALGDLSAECWRRRSAGAARAEAGTS